MTTESRRLRQTPIRYLLALSALLLTVSLGASAGTGAEFKRMSIGHGIEIDVPAHWYVLPDAQRDNVTLAGETVAANAGISQGGRAKESLLNVNATPTPTGAMIRVSYTRPTDFTEAEIESLTVADFRYLQQYMSDMMRKVAANGGPEILGVDMPSRVEVNGRSSLLSPYRRNSIVTGDSWHVMQYKIPTESALIELTLSYREKDQVIWLPIIKRVRQSISF